MPFRRRCLVFLLLALLPALGRAQAGTPADLFKRALQLRAALDATPRANRTAGQYGQVLNAFRAVYHADRAAPDADAGVEAVAELLAEEGRVLHNPSLLRSAVEQLEYLRRNFAASQFAIPALWTEGEIEARDLHDSEAAQAVFARFLQNYPHHPLAGQARAELHRLGGDATQPQTAATENQPHFVFAPAEAPTAQTSERAEQTVPASPNSIVNGVPVYRPADSRAPARPAALIGVRHWSTASYTRIAIDVESADGSEPPFEASRVPNPDRIFFDLHGVRLAKNLAGKAITVTDGGFLQRIRAAQFSGDVVRVVLDVSDVSEYSAFWLPNPSRLIIDIHGRADAAPPTAQTLSTEKKEPGSSPSPSLKASPPPELTQTSSPKLAATTQEVRQISTGTRSAAADAGTPTPRAAHAAAPGTFVAETAPAGAPTNTATRPGNSEAAIAALSRQPSRISATDVPTTAPVAAAVGTALPDPAPAPEPRKPARDASPSEKPSKDAAVTAHAAEPDASGGRSLSRALGLKINRIVIDAGHGGRDSGTLGPGGLQEKEVVLDVALRLGKLLKQRLGSDVVYTRDDDTFIPLETRTAIANKAQADLFVSVHANSSPDASARGVETYYLNFTTSTDALEVAARENTVSDESIHQLSDLVKKITLQDKIAESREFAADVENSLYQGLETGNDGLKDRGVKKAPFVVLIGANMPSILAEISFLTNPDDAAQLREGGYRQRIAESMYKGVAKYVRSLSGTRLEESAGIR